ncbi:hypothetical protein COCHEDRAFT_1221195 [Bipolaris maydis C5]|uniref:FAD/NAD(P)-binding domain-containing protein n=1 Tax=Cochliobolus heterostrophus (strain C5 / ATCC 48332 / race O) TaxID=701091 RepID=M2UHL1_COCH5|nr:hypothetical protein COCHEDRAFT_1221195 [Bipolaris maydis C5]KAJ6191907.1 hypothetical protein J3E72DRAFT_389859 [Bipolaris maydis]KAJ6202259.1 hypothetical protein J3E72DRAFT_382656 [Bipolaris maydis]KAJ6210727.1 hypothetical protein PSV09DRAFT_1221195 [Bipolaris maydis]
MAHVQEMPSEQELIQKYQKEREKRIATDVIDDYVDLRSKEAQDLAKDPWVDWNAPAIQDPPLKDGSRVKFLISGAGHAGLLYACRLVEAGFNAKEIVCVDIAGGFGGTWYWNRYPGIMCDIEGYIYLPLLEETGYVPKHKYSMGAEIRGQNERAAKKFGIRGQFCTKVESQIWDENKRIWVIQMTRTLDTNGKTESLTCFADFVIIAGGVLNIPKIPRLPGWEEFRNSKRVFHSARWDYDYTGGTQEQPDLVNLQDKTVAIVGTGATAIQIMPELAKWAKHVYVVQRTPSYCGYRGNCLTNEEHFKNLSKEKGWQRARQTNFNAWVTGNPEGYGPNLVNDGWTHTPAGQGLLGSSRKTVQPHEIEEHIQELHRIDRPRTESIRKRIDDLVKDKETAEKLKPWYGSWCKRPTFHDEYLQAFNQPNVTLLDTDGKGLKAFSKNGLVIGDKEYEIDALILATGFAHSTGLDISKKLGAPIQGRNGETMSSRANTTDNPPLFGLAFPDFPNLFSPFAQGGSSSWNLTSMYDVSARFVASILKQAHTQAKDGRRIIIEADPEAQKKWGDDIAKRSSWFGALLTCTPTYFYGGLEGLKMSEKASKETLAKKARTAAWGGGPVEFKEMMEYRAANLGTEGFKIKLVISS